MSAIVKQTTLFISGPREETNGVPLVVFGPWGSTSTSIPLFLSNFPNTAHLNLFVEGFSGDDESGLSLTVTGCSVGTNGQFEGVTLGVSGSVATLTTGLPLTLRGQTSGRQPSNMNLFVDGYHTSLTNMMTLFVKGSNSCPDEWDDFDSLWSEADSEFSCNICDGWNWEQEDFLWETDPSSDWDECFENGTVLRKTIPLFMSATIVGNVSAGMNLFIKANSALGMPLFIQGPAGTINNSLDLYVYGSSPTTLGLPLVLPNSKAVMTSPRQMLYVNGY